MRVSLPQNSPEISCRPCCNKSEPSTDEPPALMSLLGVALSPDQFHIQPNQPCDCSSSTFTPGRYIRSPAFEAYSTKYTTLTVLNLQIYKTKAFVYIDALFTFMLRNKLVCCTSYMYIFPVILTIGHTVFRKRDNV